MAACVLWCFLSALPPEAPAGAKPVVLLAGTDEYKAAKGVEAVYEGVIENNPGDGAAVGKPMRFNAFRLSGKDAAGKAFARELYAPGKAFLLAPYVGRRVRVTGKFADTTADGKLYAELWPARLEEAAAAVASADGVRGRCDWQPAEAMKFGKRVFVYRDGRELAKGMRLTGDDAAAAAGALLAQKLGASAIDWDKRAVVTVAAGLRGGDVERLTVTRVESKEGVTTVYYRTPLRAANPGGFCYPAETVLVDRFEGDVRAEEEPADPPKGPADP